MAKRAQSVVGLEIGKTSLKLVEYFPAKAEVAVVAIKPLDPQMVGDDRYLAGQIKECIQKYVKNPKAEIVTAVSGEFAIVRQVEVPKAEDNVVDAIEWELEQSLIHPASEYLTDYYSLGPNADESARLYLAVAFRKSEIQRIQSIVEASGRSLAVLDVDLFAAQNAFEANYPESMDNHVLLLKADFGGVHCIHTMRGNFLGHTSLPLDADFPNLAPGERQALLQNLMQGVRNFMTLTMDQALDGANFGELVVCGDLSGDAEFNQALHDATGLDITYLNSFKQVPFAAGKEQAPALFQAASQCATALGLALRFRGDC